MNHYVVFTDLDGTLLDHDTYGWEEALPALEEGQPAAVAAPAEVSHDTPATPAAHPAQSSPKEPADEGDEGDEVVTGDEPPPEDGDEGAEGGEEEEESPADGEERDDDDEPPPAKPRRALSAWGSFLAQKYNGAIVVAWKNVGLFVCHFDVTKLISGLGFVGCVCVVTLFCLALTCFDSKFCFCWLFWFWLS